MNLIFFGILFYIFIQLFLGFYISRFIKSEDDYLLGGRKLGYILATFSIFATWFGAESCIGTAGAAYESGLSGVTADPFGYGIVLLLVGFFIAIPLYKMKLTTIADFFRERYSPLAERIIAILMIPTSILWAAAQIRAFGLILSSSSNLTIELSIFISACIVITYTIFGGLLADAWTDLIQGMILIAGLSVLIIIMLFNGLHIESVISEISSEKFNLSSNNNFSFYSFLKTIEAWAIPICGSLIAQELLSRIFAARSHKVAKMSSIFAGTLYILIGLIPLTIGLIGFSIIPDLKEPEQILPLIAQKYLSPIMYVIFAGALLSAILSTVDSTLLASSALMSHNIIFNIFKITGDKRKVKVTRLNVFVAGVIAYLLATYAEGVYNLVKDASAFGSSGIFIVFIFGLTGKFGNGLSAISSVISGSIVWIFAHYFFQLDLSYLISLFVSLTVFIITGISEKWIYSFLVPIKRFINK